MKLLDRLEKRFGTYAVENVTLFLIAGQVIVFIAQYLQPDGQVNLIERLQLDPSKVYAGEVWRLITFMLIAPLQQYPIFVIFFWYLLYMMGSALEQAWSVFRFNIYTALSYFGTVGAAFLAEVLWPGTGVGVGDYLYGSIFLAFARLFPDFEFLLFFILPVKVKWLALIQWIGFAFNFATGDWFIRLTVLAATGNFFLFFGKEIWRDLRWGHRRMKQKTKTLAQAKKLSHECRVCGINSEMSPKTSFRYCSQCEGQCCYCPDHIRDHEHVAG